MASPRRQTLSVAAAAKNRAAGPQAEDPNETVAPQAEEPDEVVVEKAEELDQAIAQQAEDPLQAKGTITTAIHIRKSTWNLLRAVAFRRAERKGGRASVSKLIEQIVDERRAELSNEIK